MAFTAALTVLLAKLTRFPPFPSAPYLKLEFSEIPLLLLCMFGSFPMVFGLLPLMVASGVGANGNRSLGTGTVGGMVVGTLALLFIVPSLFIAFQWLQERLRPVQPQVTHDWQIEEEIVKSDREKQEAGKE